MVVVVKLFCLSMIMIVLVLVLVMSLSCPCSVSACVPSRESILHDDGVDGRESFPGGLSGPNVDDKTRGPVLESGEG